MPLYGNELDRMTTPFEAGLGWAVQLEHDFVGRDALAAAQPRKRLVGLELRGRGIARHGYDVLAPGHAESGSTETVGSVTSGSQSPTLGTAIAMAYVRPNLESAGTMLDIAIRGVAVPAEVVPLPFYRRPRR
jgi:aminomethyltransferase